MMTSNRSISLMALCLGLLGQVAAADFSLQPVVLAAKGEVSFTTESGTTAPAPLKQGIPTGSYISSGPNSAAAVAVAPGQLVVLRENTKIKLLQSHVEEKKGARLYRGEIELVEGKISFSVRKTADADQKLLMFLGDGDVVDVIGTTGEISKEEGEKSVVITLGTVVCTIGGWKTDVSEGCVLVAIPGGATLLVNLVTGEVFEVPAIGDAPPPIGYKPSVASPTVLAHASTLFGAALKSIPPGLYSSTELSKVAKVVAAINLILRTAGLPEIETTGLLAAIRAAQSAEAKQLSTHDARNVTPTQPPSGGS